jgi:hypothetical protein
MSKRSVVIDDSEKKWDAPTMDTTVLHWEWRTFGAEFGAADAAFAALEPELVEESEEIYLLSLDTDTGVKIRAGRMEIKQLERVDEASLERGGQGLRGAGRGLAASREGRHPAR